MQGELTLREVLETINESFTAMQIYLDHKFDQIDVRFERLEKQVESLEKRVSIIEDRLDIVEKKLGVIEERLDIVEKKLGVIEETVATKTQVETLAEILRTNGVISSYEASQLMPSASSL